MAVVIPQNFDIIMIPCNVLSSCKVVKYFSNG